jgi:uncharacterized protein YecE (DUF72 family)
VIGSRTTCSGARRWAGSGRGVYVYVNNDGDGHAVRNAERLRELIGA